MPDKPISHGWKYWVLADCKTGCLIDIYWDDHTLRKEHTESLPEKFGGSVVTRFARHLVKKGHHFIADRFFNNPNTVMSLHRIGQPYGNRDVGHTVSISRPAA